MGYTIGLDLGVASVGWAVLNDEHEVVESCSNIFTEANAASNVERRGFRQGRRITRRRKTRINDFKKLWVKHGFNLPKDSGVDVLEKRVKGMSEELDEDSIFQVLINNLKHRGISYLDDADDEGDTSSLYKKSIALNEELLKTNYPCEIQLDRMRRFGAFRGNITIKENGEELILRNVFTISAYRKEIIDFLTNQKKSNNKITDAFVKGYLDIFNRKRAYYEGPGNELSRTDYGKYTTELNEDGTYITVDNIFDRLVGKCSVYPEERRASAASYTAQEFNLLNDLNNITVNGEIKLNEQQKSIPVIHK